MRKSSHYRGRWLKVNKSLGSDGIPTVAIKVGIEAHAGMLRMVTQISLNRGEFPEWFNKTKIGFAAQTRDDTW